MDAEAIRAYSGVIADAAEDSEPEHPVIYTQSSSELNQAPRAEHAPNRASLWLNSWKVKTFNAYILSSYFPILI